MSRGFSSMTALLGMIAVAGYQNRDKLAELLRGATSSNPNAAGGAQQQGGGLGSILSNLGGAAGLGGILSGGLADIVEQFKRSGQSDVAESWVGPGPNKEVAPNQLEHAIGPDVLETLTQQTGLSRDEILTRLTRELPEAVNKYTPEGRIPTEAELSRV